MHRFCLALLACLASLLAASPLRATVVRFESVMGTFDLRLFDLATPRYAQNFLAYVNAGLYDGTFIHRSVPGFIIQGGGYTYDQANNSAPEIPAFPAVPNEPGISNIRGTFSMAKLGGDPNSATSEWFPNLSHNTANLDFQNGGFTVFGMVLGGGIQVSDAIAALPRFDLDPSPGQNTFNTVPLRNGSGLANRLVFFTDVYVLDIPEGDYNLDGLVNGADLDLWEDGYGRLKFHGGDFNDDKEIDGDDLAIWQANYGNFRPSAGTFAEYTDGDADGDNDVDGDDFLKWQLGAGGTTNAAADGDGDAQISGADFLKWQLSYDAANAPPPPIAAVPEPGTLVLAWLGLGAQMLRRARRK